MYPSFPAYELIFEKRLNYLYAHVRAEKVTSESVLEYLSKIAERCDEMGFDRVMLYREIPAMLSDGMLFFVAGKFRQMIGERKVAVVNPYKEYEQGLAFGVLVGRNRGARYKMFDNVADAEVWLLDDRSDD